MKVAIVCGAPSSEFMAPYDDKSWEIWVLGNRYQRHIDKRITRIFEIHNNLSEHADPELYQSVLIELSKKYALIVSETFKGSGQSIEVFPYKQVERLYGSLYLTSSPAYMIAYALLNGATEIGLYGVDLSISDHEYFWQRPCVEAWIGFAKGRGVKVYIPEISHIGKSSYVEGRDWNGNRKSDGPFTEESLGAIASKHSEEIETIKAAKRELDLQMAAHDGAKQVYEQLMKVARAVDAKIDVKHLGETTIVQ